MNGNLIRCQCVVIDSDIGDTPIEETTTTIATAYSEAIDRRDAGECAAIRALLDPIDINLGAPDCPVITT
jgi:hypothetical protein